MSPSESLMETLFENARLKPPFGSPMLSRIMSIRSGGMIQRISLLDGGEDRSPIVRCEFRLAAEHEGASDRNQRRGRSHGQ